LIAGCGNSQQHTARVCPYARLPIDPGEPCARTLDSPAPGREQLLIDGNPYDVEHRTRRRKEQITAR
jgi:hypothetical protein